MPARRFFAMLKAARKITALNQMDACDVAAITICDAKWYTHVRDTYKQRLDILEDRIPDLSEPVIQTPEVRKATKEKVFQLFALKRQTLGLPHG